MKASNILLNEEINPKKLPILVWPNYLNPRKLKETQAGLLEPMVIWHPNTSFMAISDVYSFGVLVLEMITGQENRFFHNGESLEDLLSFAWKSWRNGTSIDIIDPTLKTGEAF